MMLTPVVCLFGVAFVLTLSDEATASGEDSSTSEEIVDILSNMPVVVKSVLATTDYKNHSY